MGVGGGSGGGGFKLEKTWRATGVGSTTFNAPGNFTIPFGKYEVLVSGRGGTGNPNTPGTITGYNPTVPSTQSGSNPGTPSTISGYNPVIAGNPTGQTNAGSGGNFAGFVQTGGNFAGFNTAGVGGFYVTEFIQRFDTYLVGASSNTPTGTTNPTSGGNPVFNPIIPGNPATFNPFIPANNNFNPQVPGNQNFTPGGFATLYITYACEPVGEPFFTGKYYDIFVYNSFYGNNNVNGSFYQSNNECPSPITQYQEIPPQVSGTNPMTGGNFSGIPASGGNIIPANPNSGGNPAGTNPIIPGNQVWNPFSAGVPTTFYLPLYNIFGFTTICPGPGPITLFNGYSGGNFVSSYEIFNYTCQPVPGSPGNPVTNPITETAVFNAFVSGNPIVNSPTGGNPITNAAVPGNLNYNAAGGQNANYNSPSGGVAGGSTNVLGVFLPGGNAGAEAPFVSPTLINRYIADATTYPVNIPTGSYVTIQSK